MIRHVRLELARCHDFPEGSPDRGYALVLPLTADGHLDREDWLQHHEQTTFVRFWDGNDDRGRLKHDRGGWKLAFEAGSDTDELIFRGDKHRFAEGEYISLTERDGGIHTFRVAEVR